MNQIQDGNVRNKRKSMKKCPNPDCNQSVGDTVEVCHACGTRLAPDPAQVDDYELIETIRETSACTFYRARQKGSEEDVMLRLYSERTPFSPDKSQKIDQELTVVASLDSDLMVKHFGLNQSEKGQWYRVTEWLEAVAWGDFIGSRFFRDPRNRKAWIDLFIQMADALNVLHKSGRILPHLTLNDLLLYKDAGGKWKVKLDYKLTALPKDLSQAPQEVRELIEQHPDIGANKPLDQRSDIWTLGRLMLELLVGTDELGDCQKLVDRIYHDFEPIVLHRKLSGLLRAMVEDDPDKRMASMSKVAEALRSITGEDITKWDKFAKDPTKKKKLAKKIRYYALAAACVIIVIVGSLIFYQHRQAKQELARVSEKARKQTEASVLKMEAMIQGERDYVDASMAKKLAETLVSIEKMLPEQKITTLAEKYRRSVAFVLVELFMEVGGKEALLAGGTGTAFLVSSDGYLLTNRHVACPWLGEESVESAFNLARALGLNPNLICRRYLWFDGDSAFRKRTAMLMAEGPEDLYKLSTAYSSDAEKGKRVELMGVMQEPQVLTERLFGLGNDVAVLRVQPPPPDATPIPLYTSEDRKPILAGTSVFAMGFPLGRKSIIEETAVSRCTEGTISRVFENVLATNADMHPGNSGGPVIDLNGFAVGIATALATETDSTGQRKHISSMGRVLPIKQARLLLDSVRMGQPQWKGLPAYVFGTAIDEARKAALEGDAAKSAKIMEALLAQSPHPELYFWAGVLCLNGDSLTDKGTVYMKESLAMQPENAWPKFLFYRGDVLEGLPAEKRRYSAELAGLDWRSPQELLGYLKKILDGKVSVERALETADTPEEAAFMHWTAASLEKVRKNHAKQAEQLQAAWNLLEADSPLGFMVQLEMKQAGATSEPKSKVGAAEDNAAETSAILDLLKKASDQTQDAHNQPKTLNRMKLLQESFLLTEKGEWRAALEKTDQYLGLPQRQSSNYLGMGLLKCQLLYLSGQKEQGREALKAYVGQLQDPWYKNLGGALLGEVNPNDLWRQALNSPEKTLTLGTALGLKAEADGDTKMAVEFYSDALDSFLLDWSEFSIAKARRDHLRREKITGKTQAGAQ